MPTLQAIHADITSLTVDVIVNAANPTLGAGRGVAGAVHKAAGPQLAAYCDDLPHCVAGDVVLTPAFQLPAEWIIHAVGPVWEGGNSGEPELLSSCYRRAVKMAETNGLRSIAFPSIGTGDYGYPMADATRIAVATVSNAVESTTVIAEVVFCCLSVEDLAGYRAVLMQPS